MGRLRFLPEVVILLLVLAVGCERQTEQRSVDLTVPVTVEPVALGTIESIVTATGTLRPIREAELIAQLKGDLFYAETNGAGKLTDGSPVSRGQVVARIENREWVVNAKVEPRQLARDNAKRTLDEQEVLLKRGLTTEKEVENARRTWADADYTYQDAQIQIGKTKLRSPIDGFLTGVTGITEGTEIKQNTSLCKVMDYTQVLVDLKIPNAQITAVQLGQVVRVYNYALPNKIFEGTVTTIDPALDPVTRTFRVVGTVGNPDLLLRPGMFVKTEIVTEAREDVVLVPRKLVLTRQGRKVVFIEEEGRAQMRDVETGLEDRERIEVVSGVDQGERLITSNYETLRRRTRVRITGQGVPDQGQRR